MECAQQQSEKGKPHSRELGCECFTVLLYKCLCEWGFSAFAITSQLHHLKCSLSNTQL